jgi:hypothetical protein
MKPADGLASLAADNQHVDAVARWLAVAALVVAAGSMFIAWRSYRRGGAQVKVTLRKRGGDQITYANGPIDRDEVELTVRNRGLASVQIADVFMQARRRKTKGQTSGLDGPILNDFVLDGLHQESWSERMSDLLELAGVAGKQAARVRGVAQLGDGRKRSSRWLRLSEADLSK